MRKNRLTVLIVDDEPLARKYIREMLQDEPDIEVTGEASNGKIAGQLISKIKPDLMFLDVQMPEMDGFTLLQSLDKEHRPVIIFTTAYEEYAIRAFEIHALDYLLKPFDHLRFAQSLERARTMFVESASRHQESEQIAELLDAVRNKPQFLERFLVKKGGRIVFLKVDKINWMKADDKYVHLHGEGIRHMIRQPLSSLKSQLDPARFVQINRSVIVNVDSIKELHTMFNKDHEVQIHDGTKFPLSRSHKDELFEVLGKLFS